VRANSYKRVGWARNNLGLKLASLAIAFLLWVVIAKAPVAEIAFTVPVELLNVPEGVEITSDAPLEAQVRIRGAERLVHQLRSSELRVRVNLAAGGLAGGQRIIDLTERNVNAPSDVEVVQISPSSLTLSLEKRVERQLEVHARVTGSFPAGYHITSVTVDPPSISVVGPEARTNAAQGATTDPIDASGVMGTQTFVVMAHTSDPLIHLARPSPVKVTVVTESARPVR
jgi:YbbR domain-containing protein